MILACALYLAITVALFFFERERIRNTGPDLLSIFVVIFALQNIVPGIVISFLLSQYAHSPILEIGLFDHIYQHISPVYIVLSAVMSLSFILSLYFVYHKLYSRYRKTHRIPRYAHLQIVPWRLWLVMLLGVFSSYFLLKNMGQDTLLKSYGALALFRAGEGAAESPTFANANLFALTQTFSLLSIIPFVYFVGRSRGFGKFFGLVGATVGVIVFSSLCVSRRALPLDILLIYFTLVVVNRKWYLKFASGAFLLFLPVLIYGKGVIYSISSGGKFDGVLQAVRETSASDALLSGFTYLGISLVTSWGTFMFVDLPYRFGVDHILSMLRRIPLGSFGIDKDAFYPERIVRISTRALSDSYAQDIPPGLFGQMWLDCGIFGPLIWGMVFGMTLCYLQLRYNGMQKTYQSVVFFMMWLYILSLPMNSGSFDFVFSVDVFFLVMFLLTVYKRKVYAGSKPVRVPDDIPLAQSSKPLSISSNP